MDEQTNQQNQNQGQQQGQPEQPRSLYQEVYSSPEETGAQTEDEYAPSVPSAEFESEMAESPPPPPPPPPSMLISSFGRFLKPTIIIVIILVLFVIFYFLYKKFISERSTQVSEANLVYWGLWEGEDVLKPVIEDFTRENPKIKISYIMQSPTQYRQRLQARITAGEGPDIFRFHNTWLPMLIKGGAIAPLPKDVMTNEEYEQTFYSITKKDLKLGDSYYGISLEIDGLSLFYNEQIFKAAGVAPPTTWEELIDAALKLTVKDREGKIQTAGIALGTTGNIEHWSDIVGLMFLQNSVDFNDLANARAVEAIRFYRLLAEKPNNVWDETLENSILAFTSGKAAMIFAPSWQILAIKNSNPNLVFKVIPVPQLPDVNISWASYWVEGVSAKSKNPKAAWQFLKYLSSQKVMVKLYTEESKTRLFGEPYSRKDLASSLTTDPYLAAYISQAPKACSFYMASRTFDEGVNDQIIKYFEDGINSIAKGASPNQAMDTVNKGVKDVFKNYNISDFTCPQ